MPQKTQAHFGTRLLRALDAAHKTQADLARHCDVSRAAVSKWAKGTLPAIDLAIKISDGLDVSVHWLVSGGTLSSRAIQLTDLERQLIGYMRTLQPDQAIGVLAHAKGIAPSGKVPVELPSHMSSSVARKLSLVRSEPLRARGERLRK